MATGASVTVLSRHRRDTAEDVRYTAGDLSIGEGIEAAMGAAEVIVHAAGSSNGDEQKTRTLVSAAGERRPLVPAHIPGQAAKAIRNGRTWPQTAPSAYARGRNSSPTGPKIAPGKSRSGAPPALI